MSHSVGVIGVRSGETLKAAAKAKQCRGTSMVVRGDFPPLFSWRDSIGDEVIRDTLNRYSFFRDMTLEERKEWLSEHEHPDKNLYLQDIPDLYVKFITIGGEFFMKALSEETINMLLQGNPSDPEGYWLVRDVYNMFPRKPNSRARRHTLIFRPGNWVVSTDEMTVDTFSGVCFSIEDGSIYQGENTKCVSVVPVPESLARLNLSQIGITTRLGNNIQQLRFENLTELCGSMGLDVDIMNSVYKLISWFNPSTHKSLIQKILRTRCDEVEYCNVLYPAREVLITTFCMLLCHPGAFVPNIQRFVSGAESALTGLAVSIAEDAYVEEGRQLLSLLCGAWMAQNVKSWKPPIALIASWIGTALTALEDVRMYEYNFRQIRGVITEWSPWYGCYYLLSAIRSFSTDEAMMCSIAENRGIPRRDVDITTPLGAWSPNASKRIMPIVHCIDQHCFTDIAHYLTYETVRQIGSYGEVFGMIWDDATGINPRKLEYHGHDFLRGIRGRSSEIRMAQIMAWISRMYTPQPRGVNGRTVSMTYKLDSGWLSSLIGSREITIGKTIAIVMIHPDDIYQYVAVKKPSRDKHVSPELTEEEKVQATSAFKNLLVRGVPLTNVPSTLSMLSGGTIVLTDEYYFIDKSGAYVTWDEASSLVLTLPCHNQEQITSPTYTALTLTGDGVMDNADVLFSEFLDSLSPDVIRRSLIYLSFNSVIDIHHIGRDGSGTDYSVSVHDTGVNYLLSMICCLYPGALVKRKSKFIVKNGPLMWILINRIRSRTRTTSTNNWNMAGPETRTLWEHQKEALSNLIETRHNKKVRIIWIPPGLGKTAIITNYISHCIDNNIMPKYCVYTLPPSAMATITREFSIMNIPYVHLDMGASAVGNKDLFPGVVNIIYHDHLRMHKNIKLFAPEMMFIVDEFHKTLNATIRTSTALEISHLASDVIAMTGTLIKDTHMEPIIKWLEQAVQFEVTTKNYWVALSSIISRKIQTKIVVERVVLESPFTPSETSEYYSSVPANLGGTSSSINFKKAVDISYNSISRSIIEMAMLHINSGLGVFIVARNISHQHYLQSCLVSRGVTDIFLIGNGRSISLTPTDPPPGVPVPRVVITTVQHSEGYNLTRFRIMITGVYFTNQATRDQLEARINRIDSVSPTIRIVVIHSGIISYIHTNYEKARSLSAALKGFAKDINLSSNDIPDDI